KEICNYFYFQAEDGIRYRTVTGVQTCALPIWIHAPQMDQRERMSAHGRKPPRPRPRLQAGGQRRTRQGAQRHRGAAAGAAKPGQIGRASCREREEEEVGGGLYE